MRQLRWYVGNLQRDGEPVTTAQRKAVIDLLMESYGGATVYSTAGYWKDDDSKIVIEPSFVFEVVTTDREWPSSSVSSVADEIRSIANQKSVLYTTVGIFGGFVEGLEEKERND